MFKKKITSIMSTNIQYRAFNIAKNDLAYLKLFLTKHFIILHK